MLEASLSRAPKAVCPGKPASVDRCGHNPDFELSHFVRGEWLPDDHGVDVSLSFDGSDGVAALSKKFSSGVRKS
jgi:hypothetical protein